MFGDLAHGLEELHYGLSHWSLMMLLIGLLVFYRDRKRLPEVLMMLKLARRGHKLVLLLRRRRMNLLLLLLVLILIVLIFMGLKMLLFKLLRMLLRILLVVRHLTLNITILRRRLHIGLANVYPLLRRKLGNMLLLHVYLASIAFVAATKSTSSPCCIK